MINNNNFLSNKIKKKILVNLVKLKCNKIYHKYSKKIKHKNKNKI